MSQCNKNGWLGESRMFKEYHVSNIEICVQLLVGLALHSPDDRQLCRMAKQQLSLCFSDFSLCL